MRAPQGSVQLIIRGEVAALPLKGVIDFAAERVRLDKEMQKAEADIKRVDQKLGNPNFVANAPEEIIEGEREKREEAEGRRGQDRRGLGTAAKRPMMAQVSELRRRCASLAMRFDGANGRRQQWRTKQRNVEILKAAYKRWSDTKGGSVDDWMKICADNIAFGSLAQGAAERANI